MREIIHNYPTLPCFNDWQLISVRKNPEDIYDLQFVLHTRIFIFEEMETSFHIDFTKQTIYNDCMYIVPPLHFHHLDRNNAGNFVCIDIDNALLKDTHKQMLFTIKYSSQKSLSSLTETGDNCTYKNAVALTEITYNETHFISRLTDWIESRVPLPLAVKQKRPNYNHIDIADRFLKLLSQKKLTLEGCKIKTLATEMFCSERTLHRICTKAFGLCAQEVSYYHFTIKAIYLLADYSLSYSTIALELRFSSTSSFNHFIKKNTGFTPSQIRDSLRDAGL